LAGRLLKIVYFRNTFFKKYSSIIQIIIKHFADKIYMQFSAIESVTCKNGWCTLECTLECTLMVMRTLTAVLECCTQVLNVVPLLNLALSLPLLNVPSW
jgi:hypothetical protein